MSGAIRFEIQQTINLRGVNRMLDYDQRMIRGNHGAHVWRVRVLDGQQDADLTGMTASLYIARQDGKTVHVTEGIEISANAVRAVLGRDAYAVAGRTLFELVIMRGEETITCATMQANVTQVRTDNLIEQGVGEIYDIDKLMAQIDAMRRATEDGERAAGEADAAAKVARTAATSANSAASRANTAAAAVEGMTATATALAAGKAATADVQVVDGHYQIALGLPRGETGATPQLTIDVATGEPGTNVTAVLQDDSTPEAPHYLLTIPRGNTGSMGEFTINGKTPGADGSVTLTAQDVGARPSSWTPAIGDIDGLQDAIDNAGGVKTVAGVSPDANGNVALNAQNVGAAGVGLLYENASPSTTMGAASIAFDWSGYDFVIVIYSLITTIYDKCGSVVIPCGVGKTGLCSFLSGATDTVASRLLELTADGMNVDAAGVCVKGTIYTAAATANKYCIPRYVYGVNGVIDRVNGGSANG